MLNRLIKEIMEQDKLLAFPPDTTVGEAAKLMANRNTGAAVILEHGRLIGVFTERDALFRVIAKGLNPLTTQVSDVMTPKPLTISPDATYGYALLVMQENGFRHMPVIDKEKIIGIISSRNAMDPELEEFKAEANRREYIRTSHHDSIA